MKMSYLFDENGKESAVVISMNEWAELQEDLVLLAKLKREKKLYENLKRCFREIAELEVRVHKPLVFSES